MITCSPAFFLRKKTYIFPMQTGSDGRVSANSTFLRIFLTDSFGEKLQVPFHSREDRCGVILLNDYEIAVKKTSRLPIDVPGCSWTLLLHEVSPAVTDIYRYSYIREELALD
jgi:hypothetical protein